MTDHLFMLGMVNELEDTFQAELIHRGTYEHSDNLNPTNCQVQPFVSRTTDANSVSLCLSGEQNHAFCEMLEGFGTCTTASSEQRGCSESNHMYSILT